MSYENDHWIQVDIRYLEHLYFCLNNKDVSDAQLEQLKKIIDYGSRIHKRFHRKCSECNLKQISVIEKEITDLNILYTYNEDT